MNIKAAQRNNERRLLTAIKRSNREGRGHHNHDAGVWSVATFNAYDRLRAKKLVVCLSSGIWATALLTKGTK